MFPMKIDSMIAGLTLMLCLNPDAQAMLANAWHLGVVSLDTTFHIGDLSSTNMRSPEFEIGASTTFTVYSGIQKFNNSYGTANQTGGWVVYKGRLRIRGAAKH
jgi:hypothetical protein